MSAQPIEMPECGREKRVRVSINEDGYPRVLPDYVEIDRRLGETVVWEAEEGVNFTVCFGDDSPFESFHFHSCMSSSGQPRKGALGRDYKYSVEVNGKLIDPVIGLKPPGSDGH